MRGRSSAKAVEAYKRQRKVECALLRGHVGQQELAARYGVSQYTIAKDVRTIRQLWATSSREGAKFRRLHRIKQLEEVFRAAMESYERSRQDEEEVVTQYKPQKCFDCGGMGKVDLEDCTTCQGTGRIVIEATTRRVRGQAGEASFLNTARQTLMSIAKLEGLTVVAPTVRSQQTVVIQQAGIVEGCEDANPFIDVPKDVLLDARRAMQRLQQARIEVEGGKRSAGNGECSASGEDAGEDGS